MEWPMFLFGAAVGVLVSVIVLALVAWRWTAPFMREAHRKTQARDPTHKRRPRWPSTSNEDPTEQWLGALAGKATKKNGSQK